MDVDRLESLKDALRSRSEITSVLGLDIERPFRSVEDGYPENAVTLIGKATERVLKELWTSRGIAGDPSNRALNDLIKGTRDHIDSSYVLDALSDIQRLRNRSAHDGYEVLAEDAYLVLRRFVTILEWFETNNSDLLSEAHIVIEEELAERIRFVGGLYAALGYSLLKRFDLSSTAAYVLFEQSVGLKSDYVEVLLGTSAGELVEILAVTKGSLIQTSYPRLSRFVLVQTREGLPTGLPEGSQVLTYQEFLDTVVDSKALAEVASCREQLIDPIGLKPLILEGDLLTLDPTIMSFDMRHVQDVDATVSRACERPGANLLIIGAAGTGKTRLLTGLAARDVSDGRYRFFLDLSDRRVAEPLEELVVRQLGHCFRVPRNQVWALFAFLIRSGRCLCLLDAVDEAVVGGSLDDVVSLFSDLSILLSAASTTIISCRQSFLLDTPYVRQFLDERALVSEKLAGSLVTQGVDPLSLPHFSVLKVTSIAGTASETPLQRVLTGGEKGGSILSAALLEIRSAGDEAGLTCEAIYNTLGRRFLESDNSLTVLDLLKLFGSDIFDAEPSVTSCRLRRILVPVDRDRLRFRHQVLREAVVAAYLDSQVAPIPSLDGVKITDQCRAFLAELASQPQAESNNGWCPAGNYVLGPPGETHIHILSHGFAISETPVTVSEYRRFLVALEAGEVHMHENQPADADVTPLLSRLRIPDYYRIEQYGEHPATCVNWWGAWAYAMWRGTSLPSSTEWEVAARGRDGRLFPWGDDADIDAVNCADHWAGRLLPTWDDWKGAHDRGELRSGYPTLPGSFQRNVSPTGCRDMAGNVWEWTSTILPGGESAAIAGGSYDNPIRAVRCSSRGAYRLGGRSNVVGFRVLDNRS